MIAAAPRLELVILAVDDLGVASAFYRTVLGWQPAVEIPVYVELVGPGGVRLGLYRADGFARNTGVAPAAPAAGSVTRCELYLRCEDPAAAIELALANGGRLLSPLAPRDWGDVAGYVADPDGNVVVFARTPG